MQFNVPQFIEEEDKVIGFLTLKQFLYVAAAAGILIVLYYSLSTGLFLMIALIITPAVLVLAIKKHNGRPLMTYVGLWIKFQLKPKLYLWRKQK